MRMKSKWYKKDKARGIEENAHALGFICWQIAVERVKNMERWNYYVDTPDRTLNVITEFLIFIAHISDRLTYEKFSQEERGIFLNALIKRLSQILEDNRNDIKDNVNTVQSFIDLVNKRFTDYSNFVFKEDEVSYDAYRYLGRQVHDIMGIDHNKGVIEQVIEVEGPEGVHYLTKGLRNLIGP